LLELDRAAGLKRRIFRRQSFWERLLEIAAGEKPAYQNYSYSHRADLYRLDLNGQNVLPIVDAAERLAPGNLRSALRVLPLAERILLFCSRMASTRKLETPPREKIS
jgi:hypothetical protein